MGRGGWRMEGGGWRSFAQGGGPSTRAGICFFTRDKQPSGALICDCQGRASSPRALGAFDLLLPEQTGIWGCAGGPAEPCLGWSRLLPQGNPGARLSSR